MAKEEDYSTEIQTISREFWESRNAISDQYAIARYPAWDDLLQGERCAVMHAFEDLYKAGLIRLGPNFDDMDDISPVRRERATAPVPFPPGGHPGRS